MQILSTTQQSWMVPKPASPEGPGGPTSAPGWEAGALGALRSWPSRLAQSALPPPSARLGLAGGVRTR